MFCDDCDGYLTPDNGSGLCDSCRRSNSTERLIKSAVIGAVTDSALIGGLLGGSLLGGLLGDSFDD